MPPFRYVLSLLAACLLAWSPLGAQLDPRLQGSPTDFMDLYQGSTNKAIIRPEVLLVMDFSTSTNQIMFHRLFPNNFDDEGRLDGNSTQVNIYVRIQVAVQQGKPAVYSIQQVGFGDGQLRSQLTVSGTSYPIGGDRVAAGPTTPAYNTLIKPDGTEVTEADVKQTAKDPAIFRSTEAVPQAFAVNWVRCASHVRMRCTYGGKTRTIDFPINWAVLDASSKGAPLSRVTATNPRDRKDYDIDTLYRTGVNGGTYDPLREKGSPLLAELGAVEFNIRLYRTRYIEWVFWGRTGNAYFIPDATDPQPAVDPATITFDNPSQTYRFSTATLVRPAFGNGLPNLSRSQAIKKAFLLTWFGYQDKVNFAYRTLYGLNGMAESSGAATSPYVFDTNNWGVLNPDDPFTWTIITRQAPGSLQGTPLVPSQFDAYCQMGRADAFAAQEKNLSKEDLACLKHFVILLTDGSPNFGYAAQPIEGKDSFPYLDPGGSRSTRLGNQAVKGSIANLDQAGTFWNNATLAAVAAHGGQCQHPEVPNYDCGQDWVRDPSKKSGPSNRPEDWAPFWIRQRMAGGQVVNLDPQPIQTMTVGVSLGSHYRTADGQDWPPNQMLHDNSTIKPIAQDPTGSKYRLLMSALCGDPAVTELNAPMVKPYYLDGDKKASDAAYYFDAADPDLLVRQLDRAFQDIYQSSVATNATAPVIPYLGLGLGKQVYLTRFQPPSESTSPIWTGDLAMFPTRIEGDSIQILKRDGTPITDRIDTEVPRWSGEDVLRHGRPWSQRQVWTRLPGQDALARFTPFDDGTGGAPRNAFAQLKGALAKALATDAAKRQLLAWNLGAVPGDTAKGLDPTSPNRPLPSGQTSIVPPGDLLGDIIDSTPASVEYSLTPAIIDRLSTRLKAAYDAAPKGTARFRMIFVGTNRGFLHAFGEISYSRQTGGSARVVDGDADELWAFMPTDFLANLDTIGPMAKGLHRFGVNGPPVVWFHDKPAARAILGNSRVDPGEKAMVAFGLGKGGRSYYGLNIEDPFTPRLGWALVPDEAGTLSGERLDRDCPLGPGALATVKAIVARMGFSSGVPMTGRVLMGSSSRVRDALFLGGGFAVPEVEAQFGSPLGRSALALDIQTGRILTAWDFSGTGMGPVASGLVPFACFPSAGLVQRAYFTDYKGGLWALGSGRTNPDGLFRDFRRDSSALDAWTVDGQRGSPMALRHIYQGSSKDDHVWRDTNPGPQNAIHSMRPAPFLVPSFPGLASLKVSDTQQTTFSPATVGVAVVSGDRDNPLDRVYTDANRPSLHRITVIWDRQDSARKDLAIPASGITTDRLLNITANSTPPPQSAWNDAKGDTRLGYFLNFPQPVKDSARNQVYVPKGIYEPVVLDGALFFSWFTPNLSNCTGGGGTTTTTRICNVLYPSTGASPATGCQSGVVATWWGVTSPFAALNASTLLQGGVKLGGRGEGEGTLIRSFQGATGERAPRVRTWRSVR